jgi:beta-aspartyl-peptidase (threonine type)
VFCGTHFRNPVSLAKEIMDKSPHCVLSGDGALDFAKAEGFETCAPEDLISDEIKNRLKVGQSEYERWIGYNYGGNSVQEHDTVSAVAMDKNGVLACATSTGTRKHCIFLTIFN